MLVIHDASTLLLIFFLPDCTVETTTEVILLVDASSNQTIENFNRRLTATRQTIDILLSYNPFTNFGMYSYSNEPEQVFPLSWSSDKDKLIAAALQVSRDGLLSMSNTSHALNHIRTSNLFSPGSRKIILILSNGDWADSLFVNYEIEKLSNDNIDVFSIMMGQDSDVGFFKEVMKDPSYNFFVEDDDFSALQSLAALTKRYVCVNNIFTKRQ